MDDSAGGAAGPSRRRARRHAFQPPRACIRSTWDKNGRRKEASAIPNVYIRVTNRLRSIAALKETFHLAPDLLRRGFERFAPRIDDDGPLRIQPFQLQPHGFAYAPPDAVSRHGLTHRARHRKADARAACFRAPQAKGREKGAREAATFIIDFTKIFRPQDTDTFRKTWDGRLPFVADRELFPPRGAPAGEHRSAIFSFHAAAEAVGLGALAIIRLKSAFRHFGSST
jgi:hypothetical protein